MEGQQACLHSIQSFVKLKRHLYEAVKQKNASLFTQQGTSSHYWTYKKSKQVEKCKNISQKGDSRILASLSVLWFRKVMVV